MVAMDGSRRVKTRGCDKAEAFGSNYRAAGTKDASRSTIDADGDDGVEVGADGTYVQS